jgi:sugar phosphate isomerase/epimerase
MAPRAERADHAAGIQARRRAFLSVVFGTGSKTERAGKMKNAAGVNHGVQRGSRHIVVVANAFGADLIRGAGHQGVLPALVDAGVAGFEVRRELIADADNVPDALRAIGAAIAEAGLYAVFSTPSTLFNAEGVIDLEALAHALDEALALDARIVKLQLGRAAPGWEVSLGALDDLLAQASRSTRAGRSCAVRLVVENGQLAAGGVLADALAAFAPQQERARARATGATAADSRSRGAIVDACSAGRTTSFGMTFDVGNWRWTGVDPLDAAVALHAHVDYIHVKGVSGEGARRFAVAPSKDDAGLRAILGALPSHVPLGIEFPVLPQARAWPGTAASPSRSEYDGTGRRVVAPRPGGRVDPALLDAFAGAVRYHARWLATI